jgi:hypothetical protein
LEADNGTVVVLSGAGANNAIDGLMRTVAGLLEKNGLPVKFFDVSRSTNEEWGELLPLLMSGRVSFALSFLGVGQDFQVKLGEAGETVNAWEHANIPFIKLHGDSPAYFLKRHLDQPSVGVNAYHFDEHLEFQRWIHPNASTLAATIDPYIISDTPLDAVDFEPRKAGTLVFVKNGGDPHELISLWQQTLPESISDELIELALAIVAPALKTGRFLIHRFVLDHLDAKRIDPRGLRGIVRLYVAQLDDYVRRVKANMVVKALLPFPVIVQGARWEHVDFSGARARLSGPLDFSATEAVFQDQLGVIDLSPNVDGTGHDRLWRAAGAYAFGLANKSTWLERTLPELNARAYEFDEESIASSVERALGNPSECISIAEAYGKAYRRRYATADFVDKLIALADMSRLEASRDKPALQPYFVW